ncbi:(2Fe-2S)-binding protein [Alkaliphilus peptidifermentans]|uniref:Carbon-monoxide dehydrogenase small subunit n=1 Tax=Alkaliphilus peptidifermentans DSM 18978 TaxID=1120976 RepID=A0A1G5IC62_9FIRM|nr:(2Fe-2S)-binding protein [Alkaliphilus peptidifermentans]SCY73537.1 carbon-monoxide dehydrogenase small subunit [Alkaliphilus peptidifermentans DSM 18978]
MKYDIHFTLNHEEISMTVAPNRTLLEVLREDLDLTGAKEGCGAGECGACTVLVNKKPINACLMLAVEADGKDILTIEGLSQGTELDALQLSFIDNGALQCGYCTPGMIMSGKALLMEKPAPTEEEVIEAINGNLCRCTGYKKIVEAILAAALKEDKS